MKPATLAIVLEQLGGKHVSRITVETLSGERFYLLATMSGATIASRIECDDGGATTVLSFLRVVEGCEVEIVHRRPANVIELRSAI